MFKNNPKYSKQGEFNGASIYTCVKDTDYHTVRYLEALNWQTFASCGTTKEKLSAITSEMMRLCNEETKTPTLRTDIAALAQLIQYQLKYPVDEHCALQLGCMLSFIEWEHDGNVYSENPNSVDDFYMKKKRDLAMNDGEAYAFFFGWGIANIPEYQSQFDSLTSTDYLESRRQAIQMMLPEHLRHLTS